jgi:ferredoxin
MSDMQNELREAVRKMFEDRRIDLFIGHEAGSLPMTTTPCFLTSADEVDRLVWNPYCLNNLAVYLPRYFIRDPRKKDQVFPRIGMVAKGCDGRSAVGLIKENQVPRDNLLLIGMSCEGMVDRKKVEAAFPGDEIVETEAKGETIVVSSGGGKKETFKTGEVLDEMCLVCTHPVPKVYTALIGEREDPREGESREYARMDDFEAKPVEERWRYFQEEMARCIRCYACRNACPNCYCQECFAEATEPKWIGVTEDLSDVIVYHLGRLFHQAGRCVDCGACARACPMGLDLRLFVRKLGGDVKELFNYEAGLSLDEPPPLTTFRTDDSEDFISEP